MVLHGGGGGGLRSDGDRCGELKALCGQAGCAGCAG